MDIPDISIFIDFWNDNFVYDENEYYFELNEILYLFNSYYKRKKNNFNEKLIKYIIQVNFTNYEIINNKHIHNLKCINWNKKN